MAEHFRVVSQRHTDELVGGSDLRDVVEVAAHSIPSGIYFVFRVPVGIYTPVEVERHGNLLAEALERIRHHLHVTAVVYAQHVSPGGQLVDVIEVYYRTPDGSATGHVTAPLGSIHVTTIDTEVDAGVKRLEAVGRL